MPKCNKLRTKLKQKEFYCVKCCKRVKCAPDAINFTEIKNSKATSGYVPALKCTCSHCGTKLTKFVKHKDAEKLRNKY